MLRPPICFASVLIMLACIAHADSFTTSTTEVAPVFAMGYENDYGICGPTPVQQDVLSDVAALDGTYAPRIGPCVLVDYFATGLSPGYLDAVSLRFDLSSFTPLASIRGLRLRFYLRKGTYSDQTWHAARIYSGAFSTSDQDCDIPGLCWSSADEFPGAVGWEDWVERAIPTTLISSGSLELSLRIWNASVDAISLVVTTGEPPVGIPLISAVGFEDDYQGCGPGPTTQDVMTEVVSQDGLFAPRAEDCVYVNYFANGGSQGWLDGISAHFDLGAYGTHLSAAVMTLRVYLRQGSFDGSWHAMKIYPGAFNPQDQGCDSYRVCWTAQDEFPSTSGWEGWVEREVPLEWRAGNQLDVTLRFWNARVDALALVVDAPTRGKHESWGAVKARYAH